MNIIEYADVLNLDIKITYHHNQCNRWSARFDGCEVKNDTSDPMLKGAYGNGTTPEAAVNNYLNLIKGKIIVFNACDPTKRRHFLVPKGMDGIR